MGYVETLFGHQDTVLGLDALRAETAVSVGGRDKTVRFWKIVEETQMVFNGGGRNRVREVIEGELHALDEGDETVMRSEGGALKIGTNNTDEKRYVEGSIQCVAMIDESTFLSGGDSGCVHPSLNSDKTPPLIC